MRNRLDDMNRKCDCGSSKLSVWIYDGHQIPLCRVCQNCKMIKLAKYRKDIFDQYETDELIDSDY